eukprot:SAG25_NODE_860_length_5031_cov_10.214517_6_plen_160_part_00
MQPHHRTVHPCLLSHLCRRALRADLGWNGVGYHNPQVSTPTIDALAGGGLKLDGFYTYKVCAPARASFLTGRFPFHLAATKTNFAYFWTLCVCPPATPTCAPLRPLRPRWQCSQVVRNNNRPRVGRAPTSRTPCFQRSCNRRDTGHTWLGKCRPHARAV